MRRAEFRSVEDVETLANLALASSGASDESESGVCENPQKAYSLKTVGSLHHIKQTRNFIVLYLMIWQENSFYHRLIFIRTNDTSMLYFSNASKSILWHGIF